MSKGLHIGVGIGGPETNSGQNETVFETEDPDGRLVIPIDSLLKAINEAPGEREEQNLLVRAYDVVDDRSQPNIVFADERMELSPQEHTLVVDEQPIYDLTVREFGVLEFLASNLDKVKERSAIYESVWRQPFMRGDRVVDVYVKKIRTKIGEISGDLGDHKQGAIRSRTGVGYFAVRSLHNN